MALETVELAVIIGVCVSVGLLCIAVLIIYLVFRKRRNKQSKRLGGANSNEDNTKSKPNDSKDEIDNSSDVKKQAVSTNENTETSVKIESEATNAIHEKAEVESPEIVSERKTMHVVTDDGVQYAVVNKSSNSETELKLVEDKAGSDVSRGSGRFSTSRNSPDGAPDKVSSTGSNSFTNRSRNDGGRNVNQPDMDVVFIDDDVTKRQTDGNFVRVDHEISFSSGEDDVSSLASPPVGYHENTYLSTREERKVQTTTRPSKAALESMPQKVVYHTVPGDGPRVIHPDQMGTARVFVSGDVTRGAHRHVVHRQPIGDAPLSRINMVDLDAASLRSGTGSAYRQPQRANQAWAHHTIDSRYVRPGPDKRYHMHRYDPRDNVSMRTDGGYAMSEYAIPTARHRYVSASTTGSLSRDHSYSLDEPVYFVPSRRSSIGSAYSLVASTYNTPRQYVKRRYLPVGRYKTNKHLTAMDLHQMKYRSYKGSLPPYNVPL